MKTTIIGFDPGGSTGYCVAHLDPRELLGFKVVRCNVIQWNDRIPAVRALIDHYRPQVTIVEDFVLYKDKAREMVGEHMLSSEMIGIIQAYVYMTGLPEPLKYMASMISRTEIPKAHLKHIPQLTAKQQEHAKDAYKHVRRYVVAQLAAAARKQIRT